MKNNPLISVIMPAYNTEKYVAEAIQSVLDQTYKNVEIITIDDGSSDKTLEVLRSFGDKIKVLKNEKNSGIGATRNNGIAIAKGEYLALMDADDIMLPGKLENQIKHFKENPTLDLSFTYMKCFISPDLPPEVQKMRECPSDPIPGRISGTAMVKTSSFHKVGLFNPKWKVGEFIDWAVRAKDLGLVSDILPDVYLLRRIHDTNTGVRERPSRLDYVRIAKEALDRKRKKNHEE